jgi:hypothetical protein
MRDIHLSDAEELMRKDYLEAIFPLTISCEPANRSDAEAGVAQAYIQSGYRPPKNFLWSESHLGASISRGMIEALYWNVNRFATVQERRYYLEDYQCPHGPENSPEGLALEQGAEFVKRTLPFPETPDQALPSLACIGESLRWSRHRRIRISHDLTRDCRDVEQGITELIGRAISAYSSRIRESFKLQEIDEASAGVFAQTAYHGNQEALLASDLIAHHEALDLVVDPADERCAHLLINSAGWWCPHLDVCWMSERPTSLMLDTNKRLHCADGPAIIYPDGWKIYSYHGVLIHSWMIEEPSSLNPDSIDKEPNAEVRRVMIELFGADRYLLEGSGVLFASDRFGRLWKKGFRDDEPIVLVEVLNSTPEATGTLAHAEVVERFGPETLVNHEGLMIGIEQAPRGLRFKRYFLRVPPELRTPHEAVAWSFGMKTSVYQPVIQS